MVGNIPNYAPLDVLRCFLRMSGKTKSRQTLVTELELGEGTIKTLLNILKEKRLTTSDKRGHRLSKKGLELMQKIGDEISLPKPITYSDFYSEFKKSALHARKSREISASRVRDAAIRAGAEAAFVLYCIGGRLKMFQKDSYTFKEIEKQFSLKEGDVILVSFANTCRKAELGVLAQSLYVCPNLLSIAVKSFDLELNL